MSKALELALGLFHTHNVRINAVNKSNPTHFQIFYSRGENTQRVMLLPKANSDLNKVQEEILILLARSKDEQQRVGHLDAK